MPDPEADIAPKILEIGASPYMHRACSRTTEFYSTRLDETVSEPAKGRHIVSPTNLLTLALRLRDLSFDLVVAHSAAFSPWSVRALSRSLFRRSVLSGSLPVFRPFGLHLPRGHVAAPLAVLDLDDPAVIDRSNLFLLDRARVFFKRAPGRPSRSIARWLKASRRSTTMWNRAASPAPSEPPSPTASA